MSKAERSPGIKREKFLGSRRHPARNSGVTATVDAFDTISPRRYHFRPASIAARIHRNPMTRAVLRKSLRAAKIFGVGSTKRLAKEKTP
jgi:hypothetical protein